MNITIIIADGDTHEPLEILEMFNLEAKVINTDFAALITNLLATHYKTKDEKITHNEVIIQ